MSILRPGYRAAAMEIVPRSFGENLNEWFRVLGRTWKPLLLGSLVAFVPLSVVIVGVLALTGAAGSFVDLMDQEYLETIPDSLVLDEFMPLIVAGAIWLVCQTIATLFVYLAAARTIAEDRAGLTPTWRTAATHAAHRFIPAALAGLISVVGFSLLLGIALALGWLFIATLGAEFLTVFLTAVTALTTLVVFTWLALSISFYPQVLTMEDAGPTQALQRSFSLVQKRWWVTFGFVMLTSIIASAVSQVIGIAFVPFAFVGIFVPQVLAVVYGLAALIQGPLAAAMGAAVAVWYLDLRSRDEPLITEQIV